MPRKSTTEEQATEEEADVQAEKQTQEAEKQAQEAKELNPADLANRLENDVWLQIRRSDYQRAERTLSVIIAELRAL